MGRHLISERMVRESMERGSKTLDVPKGAIVTPLAAELALSEGITLVDSQGSNKTTPSSPSNQEFPSSLPGKPEIGAKVVAFGSDHGGFQHKES